MAYYNYYSMPGYERGYSREMTDRDWECCPEELDTDDEEDEQ